MKFRISGDPAHPDFPGFDDALTDVLKQDFNKKALGMIRNRANQELAKFSERLSDQ